MRRAFPLIAVGVAYVIATLLWIGTDRRIARKTFDTFSAANTGDDGLSLAMKYLARAGGRQVNMLTTPLDASLPQHSIVIRAVEGRMWQPSLEEEEEESADQKPKSRRSAAVVRTRTSALLGEEEETFVRGGGRLVIATQDAYGSLAARNATDGTAIKVFPIWPGIERLSLPDPRTLQGPEVLRHAHVLYAIGDQPAIARIAIGSGDLILIAAPELFDNKHVAQHLDLLTALAGDRRNIYFDETVHGLMSEGGTLDLLRSWRLGPMLLLLLIVAIVTIWRGARRVGLPEDDYRDTRSEAVDLVASLGALYDSTMSNAEAIALYHQALTQAVAAQTGLRGEPLHKRVAALTNDFHPPQKSDELAGDTFDRYLSILNESFRRLEHAEHH